MAFAVLFTIWCALLIAVLVTRSHKAYDPLPTRHNRRRAEIDLDIRSLMDLIGKN